MSSSDSGGNAINPELLVGRKMRENNQQNFREHVSAPTSDFAKKQLEKMGWSEGTGLGKKRDGMTTHIRVKKRKDNVGLGGSEKPDVEAVLGNSEWWKDSLGSTLARLGSKKKQKLSKKDKKKDKKDTSKISRKENKASKKFTDEELFAATGGTRFGMRAGITSNLHKWTRTEKNVTEQSSNASNAAAKSCLSENSDSGTTTPVTNEQTTTSKKRKTTDDDGPITMDLDEKQRKKDKKARRGEAKKILSKPALTMIDDETKDSETKEKQKKSKKKSKKSKLKDNCST